MGSLFLRSLSQNIALLTPTVTTLTQNWVQICISHTNDDRKMKVKSRGKFELKYPFLKPISQTFEVLPPRGEAINPKMGQKGPNWYFMYQC